MSTDKTIGEKSADLILEHVGVMLGKDHETIATIVDGVIADEIVAAAVKNLEEEAKDETNAVDGAGCTGDGQCGRGIRSG